MNNDLEEFRAHKIKAEKGKLTSIIYIAHFYSTVKNDEEKAAYWYEVAAEKNSKNCQYATGRRYKYGIGVSPDDEQAVYWFKKAVENNHSEAKVFLGEYYRDGIGGVKQNYKKAYNLFVESINEGVRAGFFYLGSMYSFGRGVTKNVRTAVKYFKKGAELNCWDSLVSLGYIYSHGQGNIPMDSLKAVEYYKKAADQDFAEAQFQLALMYDNGVGINADHDKAYNLYKKAADQGHDNALSNMGYLLTEKNYTPKETTKTPFQITKEAAEKGIPEAQNNLGKMYEEGKYIQKNLDLAEKWFKKSANNGFELAKDNLELFFRRKMKKSSSLVYSGVTKMEIEKCPNCFNTEACTSIFKCSDCGNIYCSTCFNREPRGPFKKCGEGRLPCSDPTCSGCSNTIGSIKDEE